MNAIMMKTARQTYRILEEAERISNLEEEKGLDEVMKMWNDLTEEFNETKNLLKENKS